MGVRSEKAFCAYDTPENSLMINSVGEDVEEALAYYDGNPEFVAKPVVILPGCIEDTDDSVIEAMAIALCAFIQPDRDPRGPSLGGPEPQWTHYTDLARAGLAGLQTTDTP